MIDLYKLQNIYNQLISLLPRFKNICVKNFNGLPNGIDIIVVGENKVPLYVNKIIQTVAESDLKGVSYIAAYAFDNCTSLKSVTIPDSVTQIGYSAFRGCTGLTGIEIPDSVTSIGVGAFQNCSNLVRIFMVSGSPPTLASSTAIPTTTFIYVPRGCGYRYKAATNWSSMASRIFEY